MAFLDNSGDIILDAVLTDTGRMRMAKGDGSFKISKYALGDDEIDYGSYNGDHASGSAYYDLEILQTPIFEAFTNNTANMKSKLISLTNNNLLFLPVIKLNTSNTDGHNYAPTPIHNAVSMAKTLGSGSHVLVVNEKTMDAIDGNGDYDGDDAIVSTSQGLLNGWEPTSGQTAGRSIRVDQGIDTTEISAANLLSSELAETQYIVEIDHRFATLYNKANGANANPSFIDDDSIASYYFTLNDNYVEPATAAIAGSTSNPTAEVIQGPRGTHLNFGLLSSLDLSSSDYLFTLLGGTMAEIDSRTFYFIDSTIRVIGVTTGYRVDIPIRYLKIQ